MPDLYGMPSSWGDAGPITCADDLAALGCRLEELGAEPASQLVRHAEELLRFLMGEQVDEDVRASLWIDPARMGGDVCITGHRIPAGDIAANVAGGTSVGEVCEEWGLERRDVLVACWWEWSGGNTSRGALVEWATNAKTPLARGEDVADPPT